MGMRGQGEATAQIFLDNHRSLLEQGTHGCMNPFAKTACLSVCLAYLKLELKTSPPIPFRQTQIPYTPICVKNQVKCEAGVI